MMTNKLIASSCAALLFLTSAASAVTVKNTSDKEITIGVDMGNEEKTQTIGAGESAQLDCKQQCGVTGPWGFSWMAKGDATMSSDGQSLINVTDSKQG
jgi:hypothetical protein